MQGRLKFSWLVVIVALWMGGCATDQNNLTVQDTAARLSEDTSGVFIEPSEVLVAKDFDTLTEYNYRSTDVLESIYFNFDSVKILENEKTKLRKFAKMIQNTPDVKLLIVGHCDAVGKEDYNYNLGKARADGVRSLLVRYGLKEDQMKIASLGAKQATVSKDSQEKGCAQDRRCDIVLQLIK